MTALQVIGIAAILYGVPITTDGLRRKNGNEALAGIGMWVLGVLIAVSGVPQ